MIRLAMSSTSTPAEALVGPGIDDALMSYQPILSGVEQGIVVGQTAGNVVGVEDGDLSGFAQTVISHESDVRPGDRQDGRASPWSRRYRAAGRRMVQVHDRVPGQKRHQVRRDADGPHARSSAAMRNAEGLMKVQVAHVGSDVARTAETHLRVHVGAIHVHLPAMLVNHPADLPH